MSLSSQILGLLSENSTWQCRDNDIMPGVDTEQPQIFFCNLKLSMHTGYLTKSTRGYKLQESIV